jgi:hypothetical protein
MQIIKFVPTSVIWCSIGCMGRPPKDPAELTTEAVTARFTSDERKQLDWLAVQLRARSASEVIRVAVRQLYERLHGRH